MQKETSTQAEWEEAVLQHQAYMLARARDLRKDLTREERHLWYDFLQKYPVHWYKQRVIGDYVVDFYCHSARLVVELDGCQHEELDNWYADRVRDRRLEADGLKVLRFRNLDVTYRFRRVCRAIDAVVQDRLEANRR